MKDIDMSTNPADLTDVELIAQIEARIGALKNSLLEAEGRTCGRAANNTTDAQANAAITKAVGHLYLVKGHATDAMNEMGNTTGFGGK